MQKFKDPVVESVFDNYLMPERKALLQMRNLVFETAKQTDGVGPLTEALRWGQPSYITEQTGAGSLVRMDCFDGGKIALFFYCQTTLVETYRNMFPDIFSYSKNQAIVINPTEPLAADELQTCLALALTYKLNKRKAKRRA